MDFQQKNKPLCSVCIANYNGEKYLASCIDSVLNQDFEHPVEIIIHDDASLDRSVALIKENYPQVQLMSSSDNVGFCISNNRMVDAAQGKFVLLLNNDAILHKNALKTLYGASLSQGTGIFGLPQYNGQTGELIDMGSFFDLFLNPIPNIDPRRENVGMIIGACLWLPKTLWKHLGGFPEWFGSLAEDMYLCCLARLRGFQVKVIPHSGFDHWVGRSIGGGKVVGDGKLSTTLSRRAISERNKSFVMVICYPSYIAWLVVPLHLFFLLMEGILLTLVKLDKRFWTKIYWNCLKELWCKRYRLKRQRSAVQRTRQCSPMTFAQPFELIPHKFRMLTKHGLPHVTD
ncbi:MAG: glycosyltransferase [Desulfobacterales bacterium]|nr:glycosyltransferase [Desulfobacterales bacterium]